MPANDDRYERANAHDSVVGIVAEPFEHGDDHLCTRTGVPHLGQNLRVVQPCIVTADFVVNPSDLDAVAKCGDAFGTSNNFHD